MRVIALHGLKMNLLLWNYDRKANLTFPEFALRKSSTVLRTSDANAMEQKNGARINSS